MAKKIFVDGDMYTIGGEPQMIDGPLPRGVYNLSFHPKIGYYLKRTQDFSLPPKVYGDLSIADRYLKTYNHRTRNTGVLLTGQKGSGKTILAKYLAIKSGLPVICINDAFNQEGMPPFSEYLADETLGNCFILLDEFDKIFGKDDSNMLTLLDGQYNMHHLIVLTTNTTGNINSNLFNRPSRIFFRKDYSGIEESVLKEIANDLIQNKEHIEDFYNVVDQIPMLSYDIVMAIIDEMNLHQDKASNLVKELGLHSEKMWVTVKQIFPNGQEIDATDDHSVILAPGSVFDVRVFPRPDMSRGDSHYARICTDDLVKLGRNHYTYELKETVRVNEDCEYEISEAKSMSGIRPIALGEGGKACEEPVKAPTKEVTYKYDIKFEPYSSNVSYLFY